MKARRVSAAAAVVAAMLAFSPRIAAADDWQLTFAPYIWATSLDGEAGVRNQEVEVDAGFGDILEASDSVLAFNADLKLHNGRFGLVFEPSYAQLGVENLANNTPLEADFTTDLLFIDLAGEYRVVDWSIGGDEERSVTVDVLGGFRYTRLSAEIDFDNAGSPSQDKDWFDPIVGADANVDLTSRWFISLRADVGGFGAGSDITANGDAFIGYRFTMFGRPSAVRAGYRAIYQDYEEGGFKWDMTIHGPVLGLVTYWG